MGAGWIWYPGDYEIFHSLMVNTRREERMFQWPAFWRLDDVWHNVRFSKSVTVSEEWKLRCCANGAGYLQVDGKKQAIEQTIVLEPGEHELIAAVFKIDGLPALYVDGAGLCDSDTSWLVDCCDGNWLPAGSQSGYVCMEDNPERFPMEYEEILPKEVRSMKEGILYDYGKETFAALEITGLVPGRRMGIYYGEWEKEALDWENCYLKEEITIQSNTFLADARAFRYLYLVYEGEYDLKVLYEYLPLEQKGTFCCEDDRMNQIWEVAEYTFHLNSREFFLDGVKRDRWIWSGDAYQSYQINQYLYLNQDITRRTILALRGKDPVTMHINSITDYSFYWLMSIYEYYETYEDLDFVSLIYPKMKTLMDFCIKRTDSMGFVVKKGEDWIFIDWADLDKTGAVCAEQMLYVKALEAAGACAKIVKDKTGTYYQNLAQDIRNKIQAYFWKYELGAYIDSYESGRNHVTRHANIFAILYGFASKEQTKQIISHVILNPEIPAVKTPYFKFYELDLMGRLGKLDYVKEEIGSYWGSMLDLGGTTFWEEYDPVLSMEDQYSMYGDPYGKSFCHAWGASPIYLLGRYFLGVSRKEAGYRKFLVKPQTAYFHKIQGTVPVLGGTVQVQWDHSQKELRVMASCEGGTLHHAGQVYSLPKEQMVVVAME